MSMKISSIFLHLNSLILVNGSILLFILFFLISNRYESVDKFSKDNSISQLSRTLKLSDDQWQELIPSSVDNVFLLCSGLSTRIFYERYLPLNETIETPPPSLIESHRIPYFYSIWRSTENISRGLNPCEHMIAIHLLSFVHKICRDNSIELMMTYGTLLGSWRHHDIIPWDDDLDLMIPVSQRNKFETVFKKLNQTSTRLNYIGNENQTRDYFKISWKQMPAAGDYSWNFPYIDLFFYIQNESHVWEKSTPNYVYEIKDIYPIVYRPLADIWLPSPRNPSVWFSANSDDYCRGQQWNHRYERGQDYRTILCSELKHFYPFVERSSNKSDSIETLVFDRTIIHRFLA